MTAVLGSIFVINGSGSASVDKRPHQAAISVKHHHIHIRIAVQLKRVKLWIVHPTRKGVGQHIPILLHIQRKNLIAHVELSLHQATHQNKRSRNKQSEHVAGNSHGQFHTEATIDTNIAFSLYGKLFELPLIASYDSVFKYKFAAEKYPGVL